MVLRYRIVPNAPKNAVISVVMDDFKDKTNWHRLKLLTGTYLGIFEERANLGVLKSPVLLWEV